MLQHYFLLILVPRESKWLKKRDLATTTDDIPMQLEVIIVTENQNVTINLGR